MSRSAASSVTPNEDQLCADMINKIVQASNNSKSKAAATAGINKARVISDFIKSNGKRL